MSARRYSFAVGLQVMVGASPLQQVPHLQPLSLEISCIVRIGFGFDRQLFDNVQAEPLKPDDLFRIIRQKPDVAHPEVDQYLCARAVFAQIHREAELFVCFDGVETLFLKFVCMDLGCQSDSASLLTHVDQDAGTCFVDVLESGLELIATIASLRAEDVARKALAVDPDERWFSRRYCSFDQSQVMNVVDKRSVKMQLEIAVDGGQIDDLKPLDEYFSGAPVRDQAFD